MKKLSLPLLAILLLIVGTIISNVIAFGTDDGYKEFENTEYEDSFWDEDFTWIDDSDDYDSDDYDWDDYDWDDGSADETEAYDETTEYSEEHTEQTDPITEDDNYNNFSKDDYLEEYFSIVSTDHKALYYQLNNIEKSIYDLALKCCLNGDSNFKITDVPYSESETYINYVDKAYTAFYFDHPEFFWLNSGAFNYNYAYALKTITVTPKPYNFWKYSLNKEEYVQDMLYNITKIVDGAKNLNSDYDKIKYVHDYLVNNCEYDYAALEKISNISVDPKVEQAYTSYGAFVTGDCVCDGYSKAFQIIMNIFDIHCVKVHGYANGGYHAWNQIEVGGEKYYIDVTWDDPSGLDEVQYDYFLITTKQLEKTHEVETKYFEYDYCTSTKYMNRSYY